MTNGQLMRIYSKKISVEHALSYKVLDAQHAGIMSLSKLKVKGFYPGCGGCCCLGIAQRANMLKMCAWLLHPTGDKAPPVARNSRTLNQRYTHIENGGHSWCVSSSLSLSAGFSMQDEAMGVAQSAPQGGSLLPCGRYLLTLLTGDKEGSVRILFVLGTTPSHASIPPIRMARWPKADKCGGKMY